MIFVKKLLFGEVKTIKKLLLAQHKNMKSCEKMKKVIFTHFRQKRKTLYKRNVLGTFSTRIAKTRFFHFRVQKVEMSSFYASGALLAPKTLQNGKVGPKAEKALLGVLGSKNVPRTLRFHCFALGAKMMLFRISLIFAFFAFGPTFPFWSVLGAKSAPEAKN